MSIPVIHLGGFCPFMPIFIMGQMSGRAYVRTPSYTKVKVIVQMDLETVKQY